MVWLLVLIVILGAGLRLWRLGEVPTGLHYDEIVAGYNGFLLSEIGKNFSGEKWPLHINTFGDYRPAMISYLITLSVKLLGNTEFSVRLPVALAGTALIILAYFLSILCFENKKAAFLTALFVAISPLGIIFSRATSEAILEIFFTLSALIFLIWGIKRGQARFFVIVYLGFLLSYFSYQSSRVLIPLFAVVTIVLAAKHFVASRHLVLLAFLPVILYLLFPFGFFLGQPLGQGRWRQVSVLSSPETPLILAEQIREDAGKSVLPETRLFHNKVIGYGRDVVQRYLNFFSPERVLFGPIVPERYQVPLAGAITIIEFLGLIGAISFLISQKQKWLGYLPIALLFLAPLSSALTFEDSPNFQRALFLMPFWQICAGFGWVSFLNRIKSWKIIWIVSAVLAILIVGQTMFFLHQYFTHYPQHQQQVRHPELKEIAFFLKENEGKYLRILMPRDYNPQLFYLFYNRKIAFSDFQVKNLSFFSDRCPVEKEIRKGDLIIAEKIALY